MIKAHQTKRKRRRLAVYLKKKFRMMIVKIIQNFENKMELQIVWRHGLRRCKKSLTRT